MLLAQFVDFTGEFLREFVERIAADHPSIDGLQSGESFVERQPPMLAEDGKESLGREVDDALPLAAADSDGAGAGDELLDSSPIIPIRSAIPTASPRSGARSMAMTGSLFISVIALGKFASKQIFASSPNDSSAIVSIHSTGF
jgi:hypothetical protein